ncbi:TetR/AcrR family transcriptional regulator [Arthrobacter sp. D2-10]
MSDVGVVKGKRPVAQKPNGPKLTRLAILKKTTEYVDRHGLAALTMRVLAEELEVAPSAVYWHFQGKDELISAAASHLAHNVKIEEAEPADWRSWLFRWAHTRRNVLHAHPNFAPIIAGQLSTEVEASLPSIERTLSVIERAGFTGAELTFAYNALAAGVTGWTNSELCSEPAFDKAGQGWRATVEDRLLSVPARRYPTISRNIDALANQAFGMRWESGITRPLHDSFDFFVETLLIGLADRLHRREGLSSGSEIHSEAPPRIASSVRTPAETQG